MRKIYLEGGYEKVLSASQFDKKDLFFFNFPTEKDLSNFPIDITHWSYFENWDPYRNYLVAKQHCGLKEAQSSNTGTFTNFIGSIRINNIALGSYSIDALRSNTGVLISQQDIFQGTIRDNITMGDSAITSERLFQISRITGLDDFIGQQEMGFDSEIDPAGKKLPEKIKQGVLLARAMISKRALLLLENPFEGLEPTTIEQVKSAITSIEQTTLLVTASANTYQNIFDKIIYLENGSIVSVESKK